MGFLSNIVKDNMFTPDAVPKFEAKLFFEGAKRRKDLEQFAVLLFGLKVAKLSPGAR